MPTKNPRASPKDVSDYVSVIKYPVLVWILFEIVFTVAGFLNYVNVSADMMLGNGAALLAILFGLYIGRLSSNTFKGALWVDMANALAGSILVSIAAMVLLLVLAMYSGSFVSTFFQVPPGASGSSVLATVLPYSIDILIEVVVLAVASSAVAHEFTQ